MKIDLEKSNRKIETFLYKLNLGLQACNFDYKERLMISASSGSDSSALLLGLKLITKDLNNLSVIHINHKLRENQSDEDALFLNSLCRDLNIPLLIRSKAIACPYTDSISNMEEKLSHIRYDISAFLAKTSNTDTVATGHTMDDNAETVILNITRGSGLKGISGIKRNKKLKSHKTIPSINVIRPLLKITKREIKEFLKEMAVNYRTDFSNLDISFSRNRIRHIVIPELEQLNPKLKESIFRLSQNASGYLKDSSPSIKKLWESEFVSTSKEKVTIDKSILNLLPLETRNLLFLKCGESISRRKALTFKHIKLISKSLQSSRYLKLEFPDGLIVENYYSKLVFRNKEFKEIEPFPKNFDPQILKVPGRVQLTNYHSIQAKIYTSSIKTQSDFQVEAFLDLSITSPPFYIRMKKSGDKIKLLGRSGHKTLNNLLIDKKIPSTWRNGIPVVEKDNKIVWVVGFPPADWAKITQKTTKIVNLRYLTNNINEAPIF